MSTETANSVYRDNVDDDDVDNVETTYPIFRKNYIDGLPPEIDISGLRRMISEPVRIFS